MITPRFLTTSAFLACAALCSTRPAHADNWDNSAGNALWATPSNWVDNTVPTISDFALFPNTIPGGQSIITCPTNTFALSLNFLNSYTLIGGNIQLGNDTISGGGWNPIIRSHLTGTGPFTFSGGGTISVLPISGNSYTGGTIISGSSTTVAVTTNVALGFSTAPITLNGGRLRLDGETTNPPFIMLRDITLGTGGGTIDLINNAFLDLNRPFAATANLLTLTGTGSAEFNSTSTRSGNTTINGPFVRLNNAQALGTGTINVFGTGVLELANGLTYTMPTGLSTGATLQGGPGTNTYNGACNVFGTSVTLKCGPTTADSLILGSNGASVWNNGTATTIGQGAVRLLSANNYVGSWTIDNNSSLEVGNPGSLGTGTSPIVVNPGGRLKLNIPLLARDITLNNPGGGIELLQDCTLVGQISIAPNAAFVPIVGSGRECTLAFSNSSMTYSGTAYFGGASGVTSMRVSAGADVTGTGLRVLGPPNGSAALTISGAGSTWQNTGEAWFGNSGGSGSLTVDSGGLFSCPIVYFGVGEVATAVITGEGSLLSSTDRLVVGFNSVSTLSVLNGADVSSVQVTVGELSAGSGTVTVSGDGSTFANSGVLELGKTGSGILNANNGGSVSCLGLFLGDGAAASGSCTITGGLTRLDCGSAGVLLSQNGAAGTLDFAGGIVDINGNITDAGPGLSTMILDGATLDMHNFAIGGATPIDSLSFRSGTLKNVAQINNGAGLAKTGPGTLYLNTNNTYAGTTTVNQGTLFVVNSTGSATGNGLVDVANGATLAGPGIIGGIVQNNGSVAPAGFSGNSIGTLTLLSTYGQFASGSLNIEIGGATSNDRLSVSGAVAVAAGTLNVTLINGFVPVAGNDFTILTAASISGTFPTANLPALPSPLSWQVEYQTSAVRLVVVGCELPADVNNDNDVDLVDLTTLLAHFGIQNGATPEDGDVNGDGAVDLTDLTLLLGSFGASC